MKLAEKNGIQIVERKIMHPMYKKFVTDDAVKSVEERLLWV